MSQFRTDDSEFKRCLNCGHNSDDSFLFCEKCGHDKHSSPDVGKAWASELRETFSVILALGFLVLFIYADGRENNRSDAKKDATLIPTAVSECAGYLEWMVRTMDRDRRIAHVLEGDNGDAQYPADALNAIMFVLNESSRDTPPLAAQEYNSALTSLWLEMLAFHGFVDMPVLDRSLRASDDREALSIEVRETERALKELCT